MHKSLPMPIADAYEVTATGKIRSSGTRPLRPHTGGRRKGGPRFDNSHLRGTAVVRPDQMDHGDWTNLRHI